MINEPAPTALDIARSIHHAHTTAVETTQQTLARIDRLNPALNAIIARDDDRALAQAAAVDAVITAGDHDRLPLAGVPLLVKDTEDTVGYRTTHGSRLYADAPRGEHDSILVARLRVAGCVVVGKSNTPEFAASGDTSNLLFGATRNPYDLDRVAGGSSGGAAAAVASGMVPLATASDGGGSIRIPASACGLPGFKPSLGRVPDGGPHPVDWPLVTTRGVLTRTVEDLIAVLDVIVGPHPSDLRSLPAPCRPTSADVAAARLPTRIAWSPTLGYDWAEPSLLAACRDVIGRLAGEGVEIIEIDRVFDSEPFAAWLPLVSAYIQRSVGTSDRSLLTDEVRDGLAAADKLSAADLLRAEDTSHHLNLQLMRVFERADLLLTPTLHRDPPRFDEPVPWIRATGVFNLTRSPAGTMPVGLQIVGPQHGDTAVLALMAHLDQDGRGTRWSAPAQS
jgi:Asp-tRNA(Asn)/Glu-tRNA(Gln) amidotransferase A subunit family amidase